MTAHHHTEYRPKKGKCNEFNRPRSLKNEINALLITVDRGWGGRVFTYDNNVRNRLA